MSEADDGGDTPDLTRARASVQCHYQIMEYTRTGSDIYSSVLRII